MPGLSGLFNMATEFFQAWAKHANFETTLEKLREATSPFTDEGRSSVSSFPGSISQLASRLSVLSTAAHFPFCHGDVGHNNIIVDDETEHIIGVIDWETAFAGPWEMVADFPLTLSTVPPAMDPPPSWNYNHDGSPKAAELAQKLADQEGCVNAVAAGKNPGGADNHRLSEMPRDSVRRQSASAMRLYGNGKPAYSKMIPELDPHGRLQ